MRFLMKSETVMIANNDVGFIRLTVAAVNVDPLVGRDVGVKESQERD